MNSGSLIDDYTFRSKAATAKVQAAVSPLSEGQINAPDGDDWTIGQNLDHLLIANSEYIVPMQEALSKAENREEEVRHTLFAKMLVWSMRPGKRVPPQKKILPGNGPFAKDILDRWVAQQAELKTLADSARGKAISSAKYRNPFVKIFRISVADAFAVMAIHTEYHVALIEARAKHALGD